MNKADFDRKYKAIKGHMLEEIVVLSPDGLVIRQIGDIYWDATLNKIVIVTE